MPKRIKLDFSDKTQRKLSFGACSTKELEGKSDTNFHENVNQKKGGDK